MWHSTVTGMVSGHLHLPLGVGEVEDDPSVLAVTFRPRHERVGAIPRAEGRVFEGVHDGLML